MLSASLLTTVTMEILKRILRKIMGNADYDFPPYFYEILVPLFAVLFSIALGEIKDVSVESIINIALTAMISLIMYTFGIKPMMTYRDRYILSKS